MRCARPLLLRASFGAVLAWGCLAGVAHAQPERLATARRLANEGIDLIEAGNCAKGQPMLERAESLHHALVHQRFIAHCLELSGRLVAATELWNQMVREGAPEDASGGVARAVTEAKAKLAAVTPRLGTTTISLAEPYGDLTLKVDGRDIDPGMVGVAHVIDPGEHELIAHAPGFAEQRRRWTVPEGGTVDVTLELAPIGPGVGPRRGAPSAATPEAPEAPGRGAMSTAGVVGMAVGGVALVGAVVTNLTAINKTDSLLSECSGGVENDECRTSISAREFADRRDEATQLRTATGILYVAGGLVAAGGITLFVLDSPGASKSKEVVRLQAMAAPRAARLTLSGSF